MPLPKQIEIDQDGDRGWVDTEKYIKAKTKALQEFGYGSISENDVWEQLQHVLDGHKMDQGLTVIGMFINNDIVKKIRKPLRK